MLFVYSMSIVVGVYLMLIGILSLRVTRKNRLKIKSKITYGKNVLFRVNDVDINSFEDKLVK